MFYYCTFIEHFSFSFKLRTKELCDKNNKYNLINYIKYVYIYNNI